MSSLTREQQRFVDRVDAGESIWDETELVQQEEAPPREPLTKMIAVRLSTDQWKMLYGVAKEMGIGPATLSRMWILERLKHLYPSTTNSSGGWQQWRSRNPAGDDETYRRMLAGEPEPAPSGAVYHRLEEEGYKLDWDREGRGVIVKGRQEGRLAG